MYYQSNKRTFRRREQEVMNLILIGLENKAIAKKLFISIKIVEFHKENVKQKLGKENVKELYSISIAK